MRNKTTINVKKLIFGILMLYMACGFLYFFVYGCSFLPFVSGAIYDLGLSTLFFNDGVILPLILFIPGAFIIAGIIWIFYRKETTVLFRAITTAVPVWQIISFAATAYINDAANSEKLKILGFYRSSPLSSYRFF